LQLLPSAAGRELDDAFETLLNSMHQLLVAVEAME
jgi:hypothetical protein